MFNFIAMFVGPVAIAYFCFYHDYNLDLATGLFFVCTTIAFGICYAVSVFEKAVETFCNIAMEEAQHDFTFSNKDE